jgi:HlyD family secretion protein
MINYPLNMLGLLPTRFGLTLLLLMASGSCQDKGEKISPIIESISESVYASGVVKSKNQYQVYSSSNGLIQEVLVKEGDLVKKGDPLMKLLNETSRLNAENARLAAQYTSLAANANRLTKLKADITLAQSRLTNDSVLLIRQQKLRSQNIGTKVKLEECELAYQNAQNYLQDVNVQYQNLKRQLEFDEKQAVNNLKINASIVNDFVIKSEVDGKVYGLLKEKGEFANTTTPLAIVVDANNFYTELTVDEYDISRIRLGQLVLISMDSYQGAVFEATIIQIIPLMNETSRSFTIHANFITRPDVLYPNLSLEANIVVRSKEKAITIPRNYLIGDSLVLLSNGKTKKVVVGLKDYRKAEIVSGLTTEDVLTLPQL